jgi:aryl-alcohol dehydrogenase-like predicted oxidoreductase
MLRSMQLGCNFYDTALAYGSGKSEQLLARSLKVHRGDAGRVATKIPPQNKKWPASAASALDDVFPADHIRACTETSLRNLGLETVDLQQFHVWSDAWATDDRWQRAVSDLKREGLVRAVGISINRFEPTNAIAALRTGLIDSVQVVYNVFDQSAADDLFPVCRDLGVAVIARVPFDEGSLTGTLTPDTTWPEGDFRNIYFAPDRLRETVRRVDLVRQDLPADMSMPELALRFILSNQDVTTIIPGMRRLRHVDANLAASAAGPLDPGLRDRLRRHRWDRVSNVP